MEERDREPIATIALIAALVDGDRGPEEVRELERIASEIGGTDLNAFVAPVLSGRARLDDMVGRLSDLEAREKAYEMAVSVCHADGAPNEREKSFLAELRQKLGLDPAATGPVDTAVEQADRIALAGPPVEAESRTADDMILENAMLAGALELLPQSLATLAIVPLQLRMVYRIGADAGQARDINQVKDLAGALGVGAAGQVMERVARRALGGVLGRMLGGVAGTAAGAGLTFATTYALGHAAKQYYAQNRSLSRDDLRKLFERLKGEAQTIFPRVQGEIERRARGLDLKSVMQRLGVQRAT